MRDRLAKLWHWLRARPRWIWGAVAAVLAAVALAFRHDGAEPPAELDTGRPTPLPPPPAPVPAVLHDEAARAAVEAEEARTAPETAPLSEVAAGLARYGTKEPPP